MGDQFLGLVGSAWDLVHYIVLEGISMGFIFEEEVQPFVNFLDLNALLVGLVFQ